MARTAIFSFACVLDGASVGTIAVTGAARSARLDVHIASNDADLERRHYPGSAPLTVSPSDPLAAALWRSVAESVRSHVRAAEPELAAELDSSAELTADTPAARAAAASARRARRDAAGESDGEPE